jgi:hypothetical protein
VIHGVGVVGFDEMSQDSHPKPTCASNCWEPGLVQETKVLL